MESQPPTAPERRIVTVLFADLVGFTSLAERLDPEDLAIVQDAYFAAVRDVMGRHRGRLEKFIGDAAVAAFGVPRTEDDDALRAVAAGLALQHAVGDLGARLGLETDELRLRVGINTGEVAVAVGGPDDGRLSGDVVNVAARLQAAAMPGSVLVGELTALAVAESADLESWTPLDLKGKTEPVRAARVLALRPEPSRERAMGRLRAGLLGRGAERALLDEAKARAATGQASNVLIVAPPGVGKTRLLEEFGATLSGDAHWLVLRLRVSAADGPVAPLARLLQAASGIGDSLSTAMEGLRSALAGMGVSTSRSVTVLEHVSGLVGQSTTASGMGEDRESLFASWLQALDALANGRHQAWLIEDLHWAGRDLLAFLDGAAAATTATGRLIVATTRPTGNEPVTGRAAPWARMELPTLGQADAHRLVDELTGSSLPDALADRIARTSDGNCLFIEELLRAWVGTGILVEDGSGRFRLTADLDEVRLPPTVQAIYAAQLDDLPGPARAAARRGSVAGRRFPSAVLPSLDVPDAGEAVAALGRRGIVAGPFATEIVGDEFAFRHALLRDAGYASLGRAERSDLHVRLARWLEAVAGNEVEQLAAEIGRNYADAVDGAPALATHVAAGLDRPAAARQAAAWLERAGDAAFARGARAGTAELYRRSIAHTDPTAHLDLARRWRRLAESIAGTLDLEEAATAFAAAADEASVALRTPGMTPDSTAQARREYALAAAGLSAARFEQIRFAEAELIAEAALGLVGSHGPEAVRLQIARLRGREGVANDYEALYQESGLVLEEARATGDTLLEYEARRAWVGFASNINLATAGQWLELGRDAGALGRWADTVNALVNASSFLGDTDRAAAAAVLGEAEAIAEARGLNESLAWIALVRTEAALVDGSWDGAVVNALHGLGIAERYGYHRAAVRTWFAFTPLAEARGDRDALKRGADWFQRHDASFPGSPYGTLQRTAVDLRLAAAGLSGPPDLDDERVLAGLGIDDNSPSWLAAVERVIEESLAVGRTALARSMLERLPAADPGPTGALVRASRSLVAAMLAAATNDGDAAAAHEALEHARASDAPWWVLRAVRLLEESGEATAAELNEATSLQDRLGIKGTASGR